MANNFPNLRPTLNLDLVNGIYVDPRVTFTRAGTRTYFGQEVVKAEENLLLNSATLSTQNVTVTATAYVVSFTGTGTITLSGASTAGPLVGTGVSDRVSLSFTPTAGTLTLTVTGSVTLAQLENRSSLTAYTATTTQTITRYQRQLETAAANEWPREFDPVTGECLGRSVWESRTNLLLRSEDLSTTWTNEESSESVNVAIAPDGTLTADLLIPNTNNLGHWINQSVTTTAAVHTLSFFAKAAGYSVAQVLNANSGSDFVNFDLSTGLVGSSASYTGTITSIGNGWYRCTATFTATSGLGGWGRIGIVPASTSTRGAAFAGDGFSGVLIWGAQLELGSFATPYIPTVAAQVTRVADSATMTGTNFSQWFNPEQGCLFIDAVSVNAGSSTATITALGSADANNRILANSRTVGVTGSFSLAVANSSTQAEFNGTHAASNKAAVSYAFNDYKGCLNGGTVSTDTTALVPVVNTLTIGSTVGTMFSGYYKRITYYPQALTSANLQAVTA
jgi:hypothetical protein